MSTTLGNLAPSVTAVIPTYGRPCWAVRAVKSALAQTFRELEVVVIVDGPDAPTIEALSQLNEPRIRVLSLPARAGGGAARNAGVREARGAWIAFLDDDDEWWPQKIEEQMRVAKQTPVQDLLVACRYVHRGYGRPDVIRPRKLPRSGQNLVDYLFDLGCGFQTSGYLCSRQLVLRVPFEAGLDAEQDSDWMLRLAALPSFCMVTVADPLYIYHAPEKRASITGLVSWKVRLKYARDHRNYFTDLAYSRFLIRSCIRRAIKERAALGEIVLLAREFAFCGRPEIKTTAAFLWTFLRAR